MSKVLIQRVSTPDQNHRNRVDKKWMDVGGYIGHTEFILLGSFILDVYSDNF